MHYLIQGSLKQLAADSVQAEKHGLSVMMLMVVKDFPSPSSLWDCEIAANLVFAYFDVMQQRVEESETTHAAMTTVLLSLQPQTTLPVAVVGYVDSLPE